LGKNQLLTQYTFSDAASGVSAAFSLLGVVLMVTAVVSGRKVVLRLRADVARANTTLLNLTVRLATMEAVAQSTRREDEGAGQDDLEESRENEGDDDNGNQGTHLPRDAEDSTFQPETCSTPASPGIFQQAKQIVRSLTNKRKADSHPLDEQEMTRYHSVQE